jgi:hypothetical protein
VVIASCTAVGPGTALATHPTVARAAAGTAASADTCANAALRLGPSAALPDCRAYEQVTPVEKGGRSINAIVPSMEASISGSAFAYAGVGLPGGVGSQDVPTFLARRSAGGWSSQGVLPPQNQPAGAEVLGWNEELTQVYDSNKATPDEAILLRDSASGELRNLTGYDEASFSYDATSADGSKVFFEARTFGTPLTPEALANGINLYMWDKATGRVSLVGLLPGETTPEHGSVGGPYGWEENGTSFGGSSGNGANGGYELQQIHAFSADGSRAFFTELESGQLYLRENPGTAFARTVPVSKSEKTNGAGVGGSDPHGPQPAAFMRATADGSVALFTSREELTNEATTGSEDQGNDLYMYKAGTGGLTDLAPDGVAANGAEVQGVLGMSEDGAFVYFVANGVLAPRASPGTCQPDNERQLANEGTCNLYVWHDGTTSFVSQLSGRQFGQEGDPFDWGVTPAYPAGLQGHQEARVSSDGRILLFGSDLPLAGYDNTVPAGIVCPKNSGLEGGHCREFYRYDAESGQLTCVTCNPTGAPPSGAPIGGKPTGGATLIPPPEGSEGGATNPSAVLTRNLSLGGDRVFFSSPDQLVSEDVNSNYNAYEWEADGTGSCHSSAQNGGCLFLLTPGDSPRNSYFLDASASGGDAFVLTDRPLVGQDTDQLADIYDAREGGGVPAQWPASPAPCASADECAPGAPPPPLAVSPASATFSGPGNFTPAPPLPSAKGTTKPLTRAQKLARALKACAKKPRHKRARCRSIAHKRYGSSHASKKGTGR